jgi:hypothetical protein
MNKLTKVGFSALCGSLATISSANAGDLSVTGGVDLTFVSASAGTTGHPVGMGSNVNFKGSTELDNGWTVDYTIAEANNLAFSAANVTFTMGGLGKLNINQGNSGNGVKAIDDKMPTAWEEAWGAGLNPGVKLVCGSCLSNNIMYTTPTLLGTTLTYTLAPSYGASDTADKTTTAAETETTDSQDLTININPSLGTEFLSGLNVFAGASVIGRQDNAQTAEDEAYQGSGGVTFSLGPVSVGGQASLDYTGEESAVGYNTYKSSAFGISFNINDDLSISYGKYKTRKAGYTSNTVQLGENDRFVEVSSIQAAYTMGGASLRVASSSAQNVGWSAGKDQDTTTVSLGLAF